MNIVLLVVMTDHLIYFAKTGSKLFFNLSLTATHQSFLVYFMYLEILVVGRSLEEVEEIIYIHC